MKQATTEYIFDLAIFRIKMDDIIMEKKNDFFFSFFLGFSHKPFFSFSYFIFFHIVTFYLFDLYFYWD